MADTIKQGHTLPDGNKTRDQSKFIARRTRARSTGKKSQSKNKADEIKTKRS